MKGKGNLIVLHAICEAYGYLPSDYFGFKTPWGRWQLDSTTLRVGREAERETLHATPTSTVGTGKTVGYKSAGSGRVLKKVKIKPNGTW